MRFKLLAGSHIQDDPSNLKDLPFEELMAIAEKKNIDISSLPEPQVVGGKIVNAKKVRGLLLTMIRPSCEKQYGPGDTIDSHVDLSANYGQEKFQRYGTDSGTGPMSLKQLRQLAKQHGFNLTKEDEDAELVELNENELATSYESNEPVNMSEELDLHSLTVAQLKEVAKGEAIEIGAARTKSQLIAVIEEARLEAEGAGVEANESEGEE